MFYYLSIVICILHNSTYYYIICIIIYTLPTFKTDKAECGLITVQSAIYHHREYNLPKIDFVTPHIK